MPLDKQIAGVAFTRGLDTHADKRVVVPGTLVELRDVTLAENGTIVRRNGSTTLLTGTAFASTGALDDQLLALDGAALGTYSETAQAMQSAGSVDNVTLQAKEIVRGLGTNDSYDCATTGGYTCYVWRHFTSNTTTSAATVTVIDEATGAHTLRETSMRSSTTMCSPRVVAVTGAFIIFYVDWAAGILYARVVATSAPGTLGSETSLRTDLSAGLVVGVIDACASGANAFVWYPSNDATDSARAITVTRSGTTPSVSAGPVSVVTQAQVADTDIRGMACATFSASSVGLYLVARTAAGTPGLWGAVVSSAMAVTAAAAQKDATAASLGRCNVTAVLSGTTMYVYSDDWTRQGEATASARLIRRTGLNVSNAITSAAVTWALSMTRPNGINGPFIAGKAALIGSSIYLPTTMVETGTGTLQNSWFLLLDTGSSFRVVARALYGSWGPPVDTSANMPSILSLAANQIGVPAGQRTLLSFSGGQNVSSTGMARLVLTFATDTPPVRATLGPVLTFANANTSMFDGDFACESGFPLFPDMISATVGGAGSVDEGVHSICALYEWIDAAGQRHQSAPSPAVSATAAVGGSTIAVAIPTLTLSQRASFDVVVYATKAGGTVYHRASTLAAPTANSVTASTVTFTYNIADAVLGAGEILYTTGGVLPNNAPPPASVLAIHQNRLFINVSDDPYSFQYSQPWVSGFGVQWNETLRGRVESTGGPVSGFASMDDKLIVFRPRKMGVLYGNGPSTTGALNGYNFQDLPVDCGCSEPRSILVMPEGVIFKSTSKGWYILGRDLQLRYIGDGVQEWDSQGVTSAVLLDNEHECRFTTADTDGLTLVYFYPTRPGEPGLWGTYSNFTARDAVWWPGGNAYVRCTATKLIKELPPTSEGYAYGDEATTTAGAIGGTSPRYQTGTAIPIVFRTGWLKPGEALQAFQRIWRVLMTGSVSGYPPPTTTITEDALAGATSLTVTSTAAFTADQLLGEPLVLSLGTARYELSSNPYTITNATHFGLPDPTTQDHLIGDTVRGTPAFGAAGTLVVDFYFNGNDLTAYQTITISDVSALVEGNAWATRLQPNLQKCDSIMMRVTQTPATQDPGASLEFSGMTMELGVKKGARKLPAGKTF